MRWGCQTSVFKQSGECLLWWGSGASTLPSEEVPGLYTYTHVCTHTDLQIGSTKPDIKPFCQFQSGVTPMLGLQWLSKSIHQVSEIILDMESQEENSQKVHKQNSPPVLVDRPLLHRNGPPRERYLVESCQQS